MPSTFSKLANAGDFREEVDIAAQGGWTLKDHAKSSETMDKLTSSKWKYVVLQEQSQIPSIKQIREMEMYPAVRILVQKIRQNGATPIFFLTWAHRDRLPEYGNPDFLNMQAQIDYGYWEIARESNSPIARSDMPGQRQERRTRK